MMEPAKKAAPALTLSLPEKLVAVKKMLEGMLAEFDVTYEWSRETNHVLSVEIWVNNKRLTHTYTHGDYQSGLNCRADLRRKLMAVSAPMKKLPAPVKSADLGTPLSIAVRVEKPQTRNNLMSSAAIVTPTAAASAASEPPMLKPRLGFINTSEPASSSEASSRPPDWVLADPEPNEASDMPSNESKEDAEQQQQTDNNEQQQPRDNIIEEPSRAIFPDPSPPSALDSRVLYHSTMIAPAEVMVIEMTRDLMVPQGNVLIIPLHNPSLLMDVPKSQFQALFRQVDNKPKVTTTTTAEVDRAVRVTSAPPKAPRFKPPKVTEEQPEAAEVEVQSGRKAAEPVAATLPPDKTITLAMRSVDGITAQVARQMAAIAHAQRIANSKCVSVAALTNFLDKRDLKQVSARMPTAWKLGFADRYERSQDDAYTPLQYGITPAGIKLLQRMHTWPWVREGLPVPKWFSALSLESLV